jgi:HK97 family phage portal protein
LGNDVKLLDRIFGRKAAELTYDQIIGLIDDGGTSSGIAGVHVSAKTALQVSTVLACVKVISEGCSTPDLHVMRELPDGRKQRATNIPEYRLLNRRPNEWQTSLEWRKMMTLHACLAGKGLSIKVRGANGRVQELIPVEPGSWQEDRVSRYEVRYTVRDEWGTVGVFGPDDVFLLNGLQWDMYKTLSAVRLAASAIGLAMATEKSQSAMHNNSLRPSGVYSVDGSLTEEQHTRLSTWVKKKAGLARFGEPLILDRAAKWISTAMTGVDAQHVETRRLQIEEICRVFGVFPIMIGHSDKSATFASSEAFFSAHLIHCLMPWHKAWTQRIDETLLDGSGPLFGTFDTRYMRMGAIKDRAQWIRTMAELGIYTRNELREEEGRDPLPGLDVPLTPLNMSNGSKGTSDDEETDPPAP